MTFWLLIAIACASIANLAMYMTCREHVQYGHRSVGWTVVGVLACVAWPVVVVAMLVLARRKGVVAA